MLLAPRPSQLYFSLSFITYNYFPASVIKYLTKVTRRKVCAGSQFEGAAHHGEKSGQPECEASGNIVSAAER